MKWCGVLLGGVLGAGAAVAAEITPVDYVSSHFWGVADFFRRGDTLFMLDIASPQLQRLPLYPQAVARPPEVVALDGLSSAPAVRLMWHAAENDLFYVLDSARWRLSAFEGESLRRVGTQDVLVDQGSPGHDVLGPPPAFEIEALRQRVLARYRWFRRKAYPNPVFGVRALPAAWAEEELSAAQREDAVYFLAGINWGRYRFGILGCERREPTRCRMERWCETSPQEGDATRYVGLAIVAQRREIWVSAEPGHELVRYRFNRCLDVARQGEWALDPRWKTVTTLDVTADGALWLASSQIDDYHNSALAKLPLP